LFICDGDGLIIPQRRLTALLKKIRSQLPWVARVGIYANTKSIAMKTAAELAALKDLGLGIVYMGLESGDNETLKTINKGSDAARMIKAGRKVRQAGIKLSLTVLLGVAGRERSEIHARETGQVLTAIDPEFVGALSLMFIPGTALHTDYQNGRFELIGPREMLVELGTMLAHTHMTAGLFHANHASNYLPIRARMPADKENTLQLINRALAGDVQLKPEYLRAL
jgi:radical SAM superfamily enzyme YgiQ (UPF0313 family)